MPSSLHFTQIPFEGAVSEVHISYLFVTYTRFSNMIQLKCLKQLMKTSKHEFNKSYSDLDPVMFL